MTENSVTFEGDESSHRYTEVCEFFRAAQLRQVDDKAGAQNFHAQFAQQPHSGLRCAPGGDEVVHQDDALAPRDRILMHLDFVQSVFERIGHPHGGMGQLALLANGYEAGCELMRHGTAQNEATCFDPRDAIDLAHRPGLDELVDDSTEGASVTEEGGDVSKLHARLGIVRDRPDRVFDFLQGACVHAALYSGCT